MVAELCQHVVVVKKKKKATIEPTNVPSLLRTVNALIGVWSEASHFQLLPSSKSAQKHQQFSMQRSLWLTL